MAQLPFVPMDAIPRARLLGPYISLNGSVCGTPVLSEPDRMIVPRYVDPRVQGSTKDRS